MTGSVRREPDAASGASAPPATARPLPGRPFVLALDPDPVHGMDHRPAASSERGTAVLFVPPWGWDDVTSYRAIRAWAECLAHDGFRAVRIDLPGTGDSGGASDDRDLVGTWRRAVAATATWLAAEPGISKVAVVGLGLGGLIASAAVADGAPIDDLVLWAAPPSGRAWVREQRAFAALQSDRLAADAIDVAQTTPSPAGFEVGGFLLSADTAAALRSLELSVLATGRTGRILLLDRDGMGHDRGLIAALTDGGVDLTAEAGPGWSAMVFHPEQYAAPTQTFDRVARWLGAVGDDAPARTAAAGDISPTGPAPRSVDHLEVRRDDVMVRERAVVVERPFGHLFGIVAESDDVARTDLCAVFLNAGAVRRIGPNRLWVEATRSWSSRGVPSVRIDVEGTGDADGDPSRYANVGNFYTEESRAAVTAVLDRLEGDGVGRRFVLIGLCAGGYWAFHTAAEDPRVVAALILNPRAMIWDDDLLTRREARTVERLLARGMWSRILRGEVSRSRVLAVARSVVRSAASRATQIVRGQSGDGSRSGREAVERSLDALREHGTRVVLAFSGGEPVFDELTADGILGRLDRWPNVSLISLPGADHTLRPLVAQRAAIELLDAELDRLLDRLLDSTATTSC